MRRYKRKTRKTYKSRRSFKRRYGGRKHSRMGRIRSSRIKSLIVPDQTKVKLRWTVSTLYTLTAGGLAVANIIGNSPYDPDGSGTGNIQPTGWDQYSTFYKTYRCDGSSIKAEITNINNDLGAGTDPTVSDCYVGVIPTIEMLTTTDLALGSPAEQAYCKEVVTAPYPGAQRKRIKHYISTRKMFGRSSKSTEFYALTGNIGSGTSPANIFWWNIYAIAPAAAAASGKKIRVRFTVTYYVTFMQRKWINIS